MASTKRLSLALDEQPIQIGGVESSFGEFGPIDQPLEERDRRLHADDAVFGQRPAETDDRLACGPPRTRSSFEIIES